MSLMLKESRNGCWIHFNRLSHNGARDLLCQLEDFDFRYMKVDSDDDGTFSSFVDWLFNWVRFRSFSQCCQPHPPAIQGPLNTLMHTEPGNELEKTLLKKAASEGDRPMEPIVFPIGPQKHVSN